MNVPVTIHFNFSAEESWVDEADMFSGKNNIILLSDDDTETVEMMCDADVRSKLYEYHSILMDCSLELDELRSDHPSVKWACRTVGNYRMLFGLYDELRIEYQVRFGVTDHTKFPEPNCWHDDTVPSPPPICLPPEYVRRSFVRRIDNVIASNRDFYINERYNSRWSGRTPPKWFTDGVVHFENELASVGVARFDPAAQVNEW